MRGWVGSPSDPVAGSFGASAGSGGRTTGRDLADVAIEPGRWHLFICYRREDTAGFAGRINDSLASRFPDRRIFFDTDSIPPGDDFVSGTVEAVRSSTTVLVLIGRRWLDEVHRRADDPDDLVRLEVVAALEDAGRVIPVLVQGALMPAQRELPQAMARLARLNAVRIDHATFRADLERLTAALTDAAAEHRPAA
jgi:TIR domain-containing protein